jgi:pimeloyl-ACP methyl ester carboxylesterase
VRVPSTDDVTVAVHDLGGDGPPLLIAHATGFCAGAYRPMAAHLATSHHVWALDFRGHGDSSAPTADRFDWSGMADDLLAAVDAVAGGIPIVVFGHSMGGACAVLAEHRRPGTFRSAYVYEPIIFPPLPEGAVSNGPTLSAGAAKRRATFPSKAEALLRYASRPPLDTFRAAALWAYVDSGFADGPDGVTLKCAPAHEAATFDAPGKPDFEVARTVDLPVTIAIGSVGNGFTPARFGAPLAEAMPAARLEQHPDLGHFGPFEDPAGIAAGVLASLNG